METDLNIERYDHAMVKGKDSGMAGGPDASPLNRQAGAEVIRDSLWTSSQRKSNPIHQVSYRACFKAELPRYFIRRFTRPGEVVYDPFMGRGTTAVESALEGRIPYGVDINPLSAVFAVPRIAPPDVKGILDRIRSIPLEHGRSADIDLSMFFHRDTESEIVSLRDYLASRKADGEEDRYDRFIRMVATNRLTGHSSGFFSVYTLPPNQAASPASQQRINLRMNQTPPYRDVRAIIAKKVTSLLKGVGREERERMEEVAHLSRIMTADARDTNGLIPDESVSLTVTSPPFLDIVQYESDNWMRLWFNMIGIDHDSAPFVTPSIGRWRDFILAVFNDLYRITSHGGRVAFEVGEIRKGKLNLEEHVAEVGIAGGFRLESIYVNEQSFSKTSNIWGVRNNVLGTNTNRIVLFAR